MSAAGLPRYPARPAGMAAVLSNPLSLCPVIRGRENPCNEPLARKLVRLLTDVSDQSVLHYLAEGLPVNSSGGMYMPHG